MALKTDLISWWDMEESSTDDRVDARGAHDLSPSTSVPNETGIVGNAVSFAHTLNRGLSTSTSSAFKPGSGDFSISAWVKLSTLTVKSNIFGRYEETNNDNQGFQFIVNATTGYLGLYESSDGTALTNITSTLAVTIDSWKHCVVTRSGTSLVFYLDNSKNTQSGGVSSIYNSTLDAIAGMLTGASNTWSRCAGPMDSLAYWDRAITDAEVSTLYNSGNGLNYAGLPALPGPAIGTIHSRRRRL